jgi:hypothetical protein
MLTISGVFMVVDVGGLLGIDGGDRGGYVDLLLHDLHVGQHHADAVGLRVKTVPHVLIEARLSGSNLI